MRRGIGVLVSLLVLAGACSGDDDEAIVPDGEASSTSSETPREAWSVAQVDEDLPNGDFWRELPVMVLPDGRPRVVYGTGTSLRMGTCVDPSCAEVEVVEIFDTAPAVAGLLHVSAAVRGDGSPVVVVASVDPDATDPVSTEELRLVWCDDPQCASVTSSVLPERRYVEPQLVTSPDGRVAVVDVVSTEPFLPPVDRFVAFIHCDDVGCLDDPDALTSVRFVSADDFLFFGRAVGGFDAAGLPVVLHSAVPASGVPELTLVACREADCAEVGEPRTIAVGEGLAEPGALRSPEAGSDGGLVLVYQPRTEAAGADITVTSCETADCAEPRTQVVLDDAPAARRPFDAAVGPDGLLRMVWTEPEGFVLVTCGDAACGELDLSEVVPFRAPQIGLAAADDGAAVVATGEFREADEANVAPGVWLLRCGDPPCLPSDPPS